MKNERAILSDRKIHYRLFPKGSMVSGPPYTAASDPAGHKASGAMKGPFPQKILILPKVPISAYQHRFIFHSNKSEKEMDSKGYMWLRVEQTRITL